MTVEARLQMQEDIAALAAFEPRKQALKMLADGRVDDYLDWALGDGQMQAFGKEARRTNHAARCQKLSEPLPLDAALFNRRSASLPRMELQPVMAEAMEKIELFMASPLEIALVLGTLGSFERVLRALSSPKARSALFGQGHGDVTWTSLICRAQCAPENRRFHPIEGASHGLLALAVTGDKAPYAEAMVRHGIHPDDYFSWSTLGEDLISVEWDLSPERKAAIYGFDDSKAELLHNWLAEKLALIEEVEVACRSVRPDELESNASAADKAIGVIQALLKRGAPVLHSAIQASIEWGSAALLASLLEAGGDPNCLDRDNHPVMGWIDLTRMDGAMLEIWLRHGGSPTFGDGAKFPFGEDGKEPALSNFARQGRVDLIKQACEQAVEPFALTFARDGVTYAPSLAIALREGHEALAQWLVAEKGGSLKHYDYDSGQRCSDLAGGPLLAAVVAEEERVVLRGGGRKGRGGGSLPTL